MCGAAPIGRYRPFCSSRCADIDLARWLNESYRVPGDTVERPSEPEKTEPD
ncbi:MAG TPA: DNA gyrase inhibitor YacG [Candidatus Angelobacter sp.]|nr:DNA gyrase inhibitor YacG [Candidatus Angelobacter sp.]